LPQIKAGVNPFFYNSEQILYMMLSSQHLEKHHNLENNFQVFQVDKNHITTYYRMHVNFQLNFRMIFQLTLESNKHNDVGFAFL
jgi:hypothetical protein